MYAPRTKGSLALRPETDQLVIGVLNTSPRLSRISSGMLLRPASSSRAWAMVWTAAPGEVPGLESLPELLT